MLIRSKNPLDVQEHEVTPQAVYQARRQILLAAGIGAAGVVAPGIALAAPTKLVGAKSKYVVLDKATSYKDVTTYNNYYEFGTDKAQPARRAHTLETRPWSVVIDGEVDKPGTYDIEDLLKLASMEERIYRMRCVEGWSMVVPWVGYSFSELIKKVQPNGNAKYVSFVTKEDPKQMPGLNQPVLKWPYVEGLRMDEANHPLALLTFGLYGEVLPNQNGAPIRLMVPWKYGFKSGKSIVRITFSSKMPRTSWNIAAPHEFGFYSNVNPNVDHPRWSQATERRIGEGGFFRRKKKTLMFNGYADQVASLYTGMDLKKFY